MKKIIWTIILVIIVIIVIIVIKISDNFNNQASITKFNSSFEEYRDKKLYGADVTTIINKAIDNNKFYNIKKDEKDFFIDDDNNCLKVELTLLSTDDKGQVKEVVYQMETLQKAGLDKFISSFSLIEFKCMNIEYNQVRKSFKNKLETA